MYSQLSAHLSPYKSLSTCVCSCLSTQMSDQQVIVPRSWTARRAGERCRVVQTITQLKPRGTGACVRNEIPLWSQSCHSVQTHSFHPLSNQILLSGSTSGCKAVTVLWSTRSPCLKNDSTVIKRDIKQKKCIIQRKQSSWVRLRSKHL